MTRKNEELFSKIGQSAAADGLFKKSLGETRHLDERRAMIDKEHRQLSIVRPAAAGEILSLHRSGLYYKPCGEIALNLELIGTIVPMRKIDEEYLRHPFYGMRKMWAYLRHDLGYAISRKRVERLYRLMGLEAIVPSRRTTIRASSDAVYPYLLDGLDIVRNNQVWAMDITYIPMRNGFLYLAAIIDVHSRYVVGWGLRNDRSYVEYDDR